MAERHRDQAGAERSAAADSDVRIPAWTPPGFFDAAAGLPPSDACRDWLAAGWDRAWADPVGRHAWAARAGAVLGESRARCAAFLDCGAQEIWFAPNGDAALAAAAQALVRGSGGLGDAPVVVSPLERLALLRALDGRVGGDRVGHLGVSAAGVVDLADPLLTGPAALVAVQAANREIGTMQPIDEIAGAVAGRAALLVDATAIRRRADLPRRWDCIVLEPVVWGGPPGIAVVACRTGVQWTPAPPATGTDRFPGRAAVPLVAAAAMTLPSPDVDREEQRIAVLRDRLAARLDATTPQLRILGASAHRLGYLLSVSLLYVNADQLVDDLGRAGFAVHSGSACTSDTKRPSHVLTAIGALTHGNLRISLPPGCSEAAVDRLADTIAGLVRRQRREAGVG